MKTKHRATRKLLANESEEEVEDKQLEEEVKVTLGDVIWVKVHGDSWWPAQVVDENTVSESHKPGNKSVRDVLVRLYGSYKYLYADPIKCCSDFEINDGSCRDIFMKALEQDRQRLKSGRSKGQGSKSTGPTSVRITGVQKADVSGKNSKGNVSEKEGKPQHSAEKNNLVRVSPRRQLNATKQDKVKKKRGSDSQSSEEEAKSRTSRQDGVLKKLKPNSPIAEENAKRQTPKQDEMLKKLRSRSSSAGEGKSKPSKQDGMLKNAEEKATSKTSEQDGVLKKHKPKSPSDEDTRNRTPKQGQVLKQSKFNSPSSGVTLSEKSNELSARRMRVMQNLGLTAPSGSPFHKNGQIDSSL